MDIVNVLPFLLMIHIIYEKLTLANHKCPLEPRFKIAKITILLDC